jgi:hypothetical protein
MYSPQETNRILELRMKVNNNTITQDELKEGLALLARARAGAHATSAASKERKASTAAKKAPVNTQALLDELDGL